MFIVKTFSSYIIMVPYVSAIAAIIRKNPYKYVKGTAITVYFLLYIFVEILLDDGCNF